MTTIQLTEPAPVIGDKVKLKTVAKPVDASTPVPEDVVQGHISNCPIASVMAAMAHAAPKKLTAMLGPPSMVDVLSKRDGEKNFTHKSPFCYSVKFHSNPKKVPISPCLYYFGSDLQYAASPGGPGWPSYIEKAYAVWRGKNSYSRLQGKSSLVEPPNANQVMKDLLGRFDFVDMENDHYYPDKGGDTPLKVSTLVSILKQSAKRATIAASHPNDAKKFNIVNFHGYAVLRIDKKSNVYLRNPHGGQGANVKIRLNDFQSAFIAVLQGTA